MSWRNNFNSDFEGEEEEEEEEYAYSHGHYQRSGSGSLQQSLLAAASRWETERSQAESRLKNAITAEKRKAENEAKLLRVERTRTSTLEQSLRNETAKVGAANERAELLQEELSKARVRALGTCLLLASLRAKVTELVESSSAGGGGSEASTCKAELTSGSCSPSDGSAAGDGKSEVGAAREGEGEEALEEEEEEEAAGTGEDAEGAKKKKRKRKSKKKGGVPSAGEGAGVEVVCEKEGGKDGERLEEGAADPPAPTEAVRTVAASRAHETPAASPGVDVDGIRRHAAACLSELEAFESLPSSEAFVLACSEGRSRSVESGLAPSGIFDELEARAGTVLCDALEATVAGGHARLAKLLVDSGADAHRTSALHIAIRHGHHNLMQYLIGTVSVSVNARDGSGASPLHVAAEYNQPKAAQYLLRQSAFVDTTNGDGRTPLQVAEALRWKEMQRVLRDPSLLFWNRAARANKLYKASDFEPACEGYALAQAEMERMRSPPSEENVCTFHFNYARSSQGLGRYSQAIRLFTRVLDVNDSHTRALEHRVECLRALSDYDAALADLETLTQAHWEGADGATRKGWRAKQAEIQAELRRSARDVLGVDARASEAEVKKAYRALCLAWHPDKHAASSEDTQARAKHRFARIQAAYEKVHGSFGQGGFGQGGFSQGTRRSSWSDVWSGYE